MSETPKNDPPVDLASQGCDGCDGNEPPMRADQLPLFLRQLDDWEAVDAHHLVKRWKTADFQGALDLANRFGRIAEEVGHHPELRLSWGWVEARIWTHKVDGLTLSDFVLAAKYDREERA